MMSLSQKKGEKSRENECSRCLIDMFNGVCVLHLIKSPSTPTPPPVIPLSLLEPPQPGEDLRCALVFSEEPFFFSRLQRRKNLRVGGVGEKTRSPFYYDLSFFSSLLPSSFTPPAAIYKAPVPIGRERAATRRCAGRGHWMSRAGGTRLEGKQEEDGGCGCRGE